MIATCRMAEGDRGQKRPFSTVRVNVPAIRSGTSHSTDSSTSGSTKPVDSSN